MTQEPNGRAPLDFVRIATELAGLPVPLRVEIEQETASTNAIVVERARAGEAEGLVLATEHQTAGRGRLDRTWETPARSALTFSVLLRPPAEVPTERWPWLPLMTGLAVAETLREEGFLAGVKWPNDVLVHTADGERKVCGILVERIEAPTGSTSEVGPAAVIGIGLNTSQRAGEIPVETGTSLELLSAAPVDRSTLLARLLRRLLDRYGDWQVDPDGLAAAYSAASVTLGREIRAELPGGDALLGTAVAIDPIGRLVVRTPEGESAVGAGDVVHVRPVTG
ncbi:MAG TPA: biotin--[acetyl-CoA-carboxylase] ligase [Nocardioides sp.]|uniref:biotin--[acetyl-CoA-carboxylase] ligase n=1 Tax=Nocardioides sp. TaxID=35761 RepID=UPI002EDBAD9C